MTVQSGGLSRQEASLPSIPTPQSLESGLLPPSDPLRRLLYRYWPSQRLKMDPLAGHSVEGRYFPVTIANWKLIPPVACLLLARRIARGATCWCAA